MSAKNPTQLTTPLYTYVKPKNRAYVRSQAKKEGVSYSEYIDLMIERSRIHKIARIVDAKPRRKTLSVRRKRAA